MDPYTTGEGIRNVSQYLSGWGLPIFLVLLGIFWKLCEKPKAPK